MIRFSVIPYVNALPLAYYLPELCPDLSLTQALPSESLARLEAGQVDVALVPIVDVLDRADIYAFDDLGICARGPVTSVLLQSRVPAESIQSIRVDPASSTSNGLARILSAFHWRITPPFVGPTDPADARIIIGDRALRTSWTEYTYDLSECWTSMTGLPFVFAGWACRRDFNEIDRLTGVLGDALHMGIDALQRLAAVAAGRTGLSFDACGHYLSKCLYYHVGPDEREAMRSFHHYLRRLPQGRQEGPSVSERYARGDEAYAALS